MEKHMNYYYNILAKEHLTLHKTLFDRMHTEGLLRCAMHGHLNPTEEDWLKLCLNEHTFLLYCTHKSNAQPSTPKCEDILAMALLQPWHGNVWRFEFTAFRSAFNKAPDMSRNALRWIFTHLPCQALIGLCPLRNRHAWRIAEQSGFSILGHIPGACYMAHTHSHATGVLVLATPKSCEKHIPSNHYASSRPTQTALPIMRTRFSICSHADTSISSYSGLMLDKSNFPGNASIIFK